MKLEKCKKPWKTAYYFDLDRLTCKKGRIPEVVRAIYHNSIKVLHLNSAKSMVTIIFPPSLSAEQSAKLRVFFTSIEH